MTTPSPDLLRQLDSWSADDRALALDELDRFRKADWHPFYCGNWSCDGKPHDQWTWRHARGDQHPPRGSWNTWIELSGRGAGKTRSGAEWVHRHAQKPIRIALVAPTAPDCRDIMVEGESGLIPKQSPSNPCVYEPSKRKITWQSGAMATLFTAERADRIRGPQHHIAWMDEALFMANIDEVWDNLQFGLRLGQHPRTHITSTPRPRPWLRKLLLQKGVVRSTSSTYANIDNLAPTFREAVLARYEGTRLGQQEIHGEILEDIEGALWSTPMIDGNRVLRAPDPLDAVVIAIDPPGSTAGAECGIVAVGRAQAHGYILGDFSGRYTPGEWAREAIRLYHLLDADAIVAETNFGGQMVTNTIRTAEGGATLPVIPVNSQRGKALRAEPIVGLYERGHIHHVGVLNVLETQMTEWVPDSGEDSPDRLDALVHGLTHLMVAAPPSQLHNPARSTRRIQRTYVA